MPNAKNERFVTSRIADFLLQRLIAVVRSGQYPVGPPTGVPFKMSYCIRYFWAFQFKSSAPSPDVPEIMASEIQYAHM